MRRTRGIFDIIGALQQFWANLRKGDPVAIGLLAFLLLLMAVAGAIWWVDRRRQRRERAGARGSRRGR